MIGFSRDNQCDTAEYLYESFLFWVVYYADNVDEQEHFSLSLGSPEVVREHRARETVDQVTSLKMVPHECKYESNICAPFGPDLHQ